MGADIVPTVLILSGVASYLTGSIPSGVLIANRQGVVLQTVGSHNIGATNVARSIGKKAGAIALLADIAKGLFPVLLARWLSAEPLVYACVGFAAILGHVFPIFLNFKGGKGVATALGVFLGLAPLAVLGALLAFCISFGFKRIVSLSSVIAMLVTPGSVFVFDYSEPIVLASILTSALVIFRHSDNIQRILTGQEEQFRFKKPPGPI